MDADGLKLLTDKELTELANRLDELVGEAVGFDRGGTGLSSRARQKLRARIQAASDRLAALAVDVNPISQPASVLDPSDPAIVGEIIALRLLAQPRVPLDVVGGTRFYGSGVYAIYYRGEFDAYAPLRESETPIYVGKVDPKDHGAATPEEQGERLWKRLVQDHAKNIGRVENLDLGDFDCRFLVVRSAWQSTAETYLIERFHPVWNNESKVCYGFGKHGDSASTRANTRSPWDELHPGRPWAWADGNTPYEGGEAKVRADVAAHFDRHPPQ